MKFLKQNNYQAIYLKVWQLICIPLKIHIFKGVFNCEFKYVNAINAEKVKIEALKLCSSL